MNFNPENIASESSICLPQWQTFRAIEHLLSQTYTNMWIDVSLPLAVAQEPPFKICGKPVITIAEEISDEIITESILDCTELNIEVEKGDIQRDYVNPADDSTLSICLQSYKYDTVDVTEMFFNFTIIIKIFDTAIIQCIKLPISRRRSYNY